MYTKIQTNTIQSLRTSIESHSRPWVKVWTNMNLYTELNSPWVKVWTNLNLYTPWGCLAMFLIRSFERFCYVPLLPCCGFIFIEGAIISTWKHTLSYFVSFIISRTLGFLNDSAFFFFNLIIFLTWEEYLIKISPVILQKLKMI